VADSRWTGRTRLLFLLLAGCWGLNYPFVVLALHSASPLWLAFLRAAVGLAASAVVVSLLGSWRTLDRAGRRDAALLGLLNTTAFFGLWFWAARFVSPGVAAILIYTFPLWVALLSIPVLGSRLAALQWGAVAVGFAGVVLVSGVGFAGSGSIPLSAAIALGLAAISWAVGTVLMRRRFDRGEMLEANVYQLVGGSLGLLLAVAVFEPLPLPQASSDLVAAVLWLGVMGTAIAYSIWYTLLGQTAAAPLSAYLFLVPVVALAASAVYFGERLSVVQLGGVALVVISIYGVGRGAIGGRTSAEVVLAD
jgi:drug/metabolite transporter (DMT)-like permease